MKESEMTDYLASIKRNVTSTDVTYRVNGNEITYRTTLDSDSNFVRAAIYVGGWQRGIYKTKNGATRALKRLGINA